MLDGVYTAPDAWSAPTFHHAARITDAEVAKLLFTIRSRVLRLCRRRGLMGEEGELGASDFAESQGLLPLLCAASIQGRSALDSEPGARIERRGIPETSVPGRAVVVKELCADLDGFSLHAAVKIDAGETSRLEHLCGVSPVPPKVDWSAQLGAPKGTHHPPAAFEQTLVSRTRRPCRARTARAVPRRHHALHLRAARVH